MQGDFNNIKIQGMATAVPEYVADNKDYGTVFGEHRLKKQIRITGVNQRHVAGKRQRVSDLCFTATERLINHLKWNREDIKVLIYATQAPDYKLPSTAFVLQDRLNLGKDCLVFDMNLGCSAAPVCIQTVGALLQTCEEGCKGLVLVGELDASVDDSIPLKIDMLTNSLLFGAAGSAIALEVIPDNKMSFMSMSDGSGFDAIIVRNKNPLEMDGGKVFKFAINTVTESIFDFKKYFKVDEDEVDYYIFHQAQKLILDSIADTCSLPEEKVLSSLEEYGNTSGASIPLTVCSHLDLYKDKSKLNLFFCGFGVGLSWSILYAQVEVSGILPLIETNEHFDENKKPVGVLRGKNVLVFGADTKEGEFITRYLDDSNAYVYLAGQSMEKMNQIVETLFWKAHVISYEARESFNLSNMYKELEEENINLDGILFADPTMENGEIKKIVDGLFNKGYLDQEASIILFYRKKKVDLSESSITKATLEQFLDCLVNEYKDKTIRINGILFESQGLILNQYAENWHDWFKKQLDAGCSGDPFITYHMGHVVKFLLEDNSKYITGAVLPVELLQKEGTPVLKSI